MSDFIKIPVRTVGDLTFIDFQREGDGFRLANGTFLTRDNVLLLLCGNSDLPTAVGVIAHLPELAKPPGLVFANQQRFFNHLANQHRARSAWLRHFLLGENPSKTIFETDWQFYQPHAELDSLLFGLCRDLHARDSELQAIFQGKNGAIALWLYCLSTTAKRLLEETEGGITEATGKRTAETSNRKLLKAMVNGKLRIEGGGEHFVEFFADPENALLVKAADLAQQPAQKDFWGIFDEYARKRSKLERKIWRDKNYQSAYVDADDNFLTTGFQGRLKGTLRARESSETSEI